MPQKAANQDYSKRAGRDENGRLLSDPDVTLEELPQFHARVAYGEDAPPQRT